MIRNFKIPPIISPLPLRQVLLEDFKSIAELPISGGWGYTMEDAIIIDKNDAIVNKDLPFDGISIEYKIAEKRLFEELIVFRPKEEKWGHIKSKIKSVMTYSKNGRAFDHLVFDVKAHNTKDYLMLEEELKCASNNSFNIYDYDEKFENLYYHTTTEYWFDVTSFK